MVKAEKCWRILLLLLSHALLLFRSYVKPNFYCREYENIHYTFSRPAVYISMFLLAQRSGKITFSWEFYLSK